jgi:hypothetical protein
MCALEVSIPTQGFGGGFEENMYFMNVHTRLRWLYTVEVGSSEWAKE